MVLLKVMYNNEDRNIGANNNQYYDLIIINALKYFILSKHSVIWYNF